MTDIFELFASLGFTQEAEIARRSFYRLADFLPGLILGLCAFILVGLLARRLRGLSERFLHRRHGAEFSHTIASIVQGVTLAIGVLCSLAIIFPSITPATIIGSLGLSSVAVGFAFKEILQNFLAGSLIVFSQPFKIGDTIQVKEFKGRVLQIAIRETRLLGEDGSLIIIPNGEVYSNPIRVYPHARPAAVVAGEGLTS